jgi:hypothetical protein
MDVPLDDLQSWLAAQRQEGRPLGLDAAPPAETALPVDAAADSSCAAKRASPPATGGAPMAFDVAFAVAGRWPSGRRHPVRRPGAGRAAPCAGDAFVAIAGSAHMAWLLPSERARGASAILFEPPAPADCRPRLTRSPCRACARMGAMADSSTARPRGR